MRSRGLPAIGLAALGLLAATPAEVVAEGSASCPTGDAAAAPLCETYCELLGCLDEPHDEACSALADAFQVRTGDVLSCAVHP